MSVLFLSSGNEIHEQEKLLMQSLSASSYILYACTKHSPLASMANFYEIPLMEIPKSLLGQFFALRAYFKKTRTTTIHVLDDKALKVARYVRMSIKQPLKIVVSHHSSIDISAPDPFLLPNAYAIRALLAKKAHVLFVSSPELFNTLQEKNLENNTLGLLPYSIDLSDAFPKILSAQTLKKPAPSKRFIFLVDTTLEKDSGIELLLEALAVLKENLPTKSPVVEVHICGTGSLFHELIDKAHELDVASMLAFFGDNDSQIFYKNSHAIICPASAGEGDFRTIINGWRASLPVITSDISVHTRLVLSGTSNQSALIFPRDNAEILAQCMLQIIRDKTVRENLNATGKSMLLISQHEDLGPKYLKLLRKY